MSKKTSPDTFPRMDEYLSYLEAILGRSPLTVKEYRYDLRLFFRYLIQSWGSTGDLAFEEIPIDQITEEDLRSIDLADFYSFLTWLTRERNASAANRARKTSSLRGFFSYLNKRARILDTDPTIELESPKQIKRLPRYLNLDESRRLLQSQREKVDDPFASRNYCILVLFLNCGMRLAELCGLDLKDIRGDQLRVIGKGNKERFIYLNQACQWAIEDYLEDRPKKGLKDPEALFISRQGNRISHAAVQRMIDLALREIGLDPKLYSTHKLRHTAATLMFQYGEVDIRILQEILGHESLATTEIYTHVAEAQLKHAVARNPLATEMPPERLTEPDDDSATEA